MGASARGQNSSRVQILVVEDHEATAEMVVMLLEDEGYKVEWCDTGRCAIEALSRVKLGKSKPAPPDLVLLDLTLPDMDSVEMVKELHSTVGDLPPVIVMSAKTVGSVQQAAVLIGAMAVVRKPFHVEELLDRIETILEGKQPIPVQGSQSFTSS